MKQHIFKNKKNMAIASIILIIISPLFIHKFLVPVQYNQFLIQQLELEYSTISITTLTEMIVSSYASGLNYIKNNQPKDPSLENPKSMFSYVFANIPYYAIVYPTEQFYYFNAIIDERQISGNIRIADADKGKISIAYFQVHDSGYSDIKTAQFTENDGIIIDRISDYNYKVTYEGKTVNFKIPKTDITPPKKTKLLPDEEFVGHIHDESGIKFFLLFNNKTNSLYEILDKENRITDKFRAIDENTIIGTRTGFVFYQDEELNRKILIGVHLDNIVANNYLDGPGDQAPISIPIRDKLHAAYPHTMLGDGIDEFGVSLNQTGGWKRVAITPFIRYVTLQQITDRTNYCLSKELDKSLLFVCLTREFWDTKQFRENIISKLREEGKDITKVREFYEV